MKEIVLVKKENVKKEFQQSNPKTFDEKKKELWKSYPQNQNTFPERKILAQAENSSKEQIEKESEVVIEKPNFDKIENISPEKKARLLKINKIDAKKQEYSTSKNLKRGLTAICFCLLISFVIFSSVKIATTVKNINSAETLYEASVVDLLQKVNSVETGNRTLDLFETFPEEELGASSLNISSNWFDRVCNFLSGMFGG